jgi:tRNA A-37 threonylcarbamoyl transferase component Bud32
VAVPEVGVTMNPREILAHIAARLPDFHASGEPQPLSGGYLNYVWRVPGRPRPVIVKLAPPFVASIPAVPLDPGRTAIEARAMQAFGSGGPLENLATDAVRPPQLLDFDAGTNILVMEDACSCPDLGAWLREGVGVESEARRFGATIGNFIGTLHARTFGDEGLAASFDNGAMQRVRLEVHYRPIAALCREAGFPDAGALGRAARELGETLQGPGVCLTMGDLWPASIIVAPSGLRVIDWELAHFGQPFQDVAHLAAHLWMHAHRAPLPAAAERARACLAGFLESYGATLGSLLPRLLGDDGMRRCAVHFGCEILARTLGSFQDGYLYQGLAQDSTILREAVSVAVQHLRAPEHSETFAALESPAGSL